MRDNIRAKFNVTAAAAWFKTVEGLPYGYHNFIFGWMDIPEKNVPPVATLDLLYVLMSHFQHVFWNVGQKSLDSLVGEALNKRLGT